MSDITPELDGWEDIDEKAKNSPPALANRSLIAASKKIVLGVVNLRFSISSLKTDISGLKQQLEILNKNLEDFNRESSKWAIRSFWTNLSIAFATLATAVAAFIAIFFKR